MTTPSCPLWKTLILSFNQPVLQISGSCGLPWTCPVAPDTHMWVNELSPWYHLFVLLHTPCTVSIWNRKTVPPVHILRKTLFFTRACCKCSKLESKLNFWTVISKNKTPFYQWQACRSAARAIQLQASGVQVRRVLAVADSTDNRHFQHPMDHGWPSCACFFPWLTQFICVTQFDFLGKCGNFLLAFTTAPASNIWWAVGICQLKLLAQVSSMQVSHCTLRLQLNTCVA